ncbi:putative phosphoribosylformylglycinamidine cyclo-ligase [Pavlovales sp. CCMP2436]|nr:putative phosphoribosylformylglycinamidine cyclo-ligase [Pavlovales sp. CCMP2436]
MSDGHAAEERHDERYQQRGVSAGKSEVHAAISGVDAGLYPGAFCKIVPDLLTGSEEHALVIHADGAGTKSSLAYLAWKEGVGDQVWPGIAQDSLVMNLDDLACVGCLGPFLISNTIGRNAKLIPGPIIAGIVNGYQALCDKLTGLGIPCIMTGGETADVGDLVRTLIVDSTITARLKRDDIIDAAEMTPGDVIVGFESTGTATWEVVKNAGMGSNGLTSARHELLGADYRAKYPETYAPEVPADLVYCGKFKFNDPLPGDPHFTVGEAILSPTRTYLPLIRELLAAIPRRVGIPSQMCPGGLATGPSLFRRRGHWKGLHVWWVPNVTYVPPLFAALKEATGQSWAECYSVYNMGWRLEAILPAAHAQTAIDVAAKLGVHAQIVGRVESTGTDAREVIVKTPDGDVTYR